MNTKIDVVDEITENLFYTLRLIHKKLLKVEDAALIKDLSRPHFAIMMMLSEVGKLPISAIGKRLLIPKPQMTNLVDRLIKLGIVDRLPDLRDRRIINIALTNKGIEVLGELRKAIESNVRDKLTYLRNEELEELAVSLAKLRAIGAKLD